MRPRDLQALLSKTCDKTYSKAPRLRNELLNRSELSTTAARARRILLEHMVRDGGHERLGIIGFPPEYSMYQSLLVEGGFHRLNRHNKLAIGAPPVRGQAGNYRPAWLAINRFIESARTQRRPLTELIQLLKAPPFGFREGPIPILISVALLSDENELALYEDGLFVPEIKIETLERLVRRPETFSLRSFNLNRQERIVVRKLLKLEKHLTARSPMPAVTGSGSLVSIVRALIHMVESLPPYAQRTRRGILDSTQRVRNILRTAVDPRSLLFEDLPDELKIDVSTKGGPEEYSTVLVEHANELLNAYPTMLDMLEEFIGSAFNTAKRGNELREELRKRAISLLEVSNDQKLNMFLKIASRVSRSNGEDWREAIGRAVVDGRPPSHWQDEDVDSCKTNLRIMAVRCDALSELVVGSGSGASVTVASIGLLEPGTRERRAVVACSGENSVPVENLTRELQRASARSGLDSRLQLLALVLAAKDLLRVEHPLADVELGKQET